MAGIAILVFRKLGKKVFIGVYRLSIQYKCFEMRIANLIRFRLTDTHF